MDWSKGLNIQNYFSESRFKKNPSAYLTGGFILTRFLIVIALIFGAVYHSVWIGPGGYSGAGTNVFIQLLPISVVICIAVAFIFFKYYLKNTNLLLLNAMVWDVSDLLVPGAKELLTFSLRFALTGWATGIFVLILNALIAVWLAGDQEWIPVAMLYLTCASALTLLAMTEYLLLSNWVSPVVDWIKQKKMKHSFESIRAYDESLWVFGVLFLLSLLIYGLMNEIDSGTIPLNNQTYSSGNGFWLLLSVWILTGMWVVVRRYRQWKLFHDYMDTVGGQRIWTSSEHRIVPELWILLSRVEKVTGRFYEIFLNIENNSSEMNAATKVVAETSSEQNAALIRQSASVTQTSSTLQELVQTSKQIAESASAVVNYAENTEKKADQGLKGMQSTVAQVQKVRDGNELNLSEVIVLSEAIIEIDQVLNFIISIADETNLIALNAAIEAGSAGEQGKRFKIVANEVRRLSTRVTKSIRMIKDITRKIQDATSQLVQTVQVHQEVIDESVQWVNQALVNLEEILEGAVQSADAAKQIYVAIQQQKIANQQISISFNDISGDIQRIASASDRYGQYVKTLRKFSSNIESALHNLNMDMITKNDDEWTLR